MSHPLSGKKIRIVEDEFLIAMDIEQDLHVAGAHVIGTAATVDEALVLIDGNEWIDAASLDISLGEDNSFPIADALASRGIPFIFATGHDRLNAPSRFDGITRIVKPASARTMLRALELCLSVSTRP